MTLILMILLINFVGMWYYEASNKKRDKEGYREQVTGFDGVDPDIIQGAINNDISEVRAALKIDWTVINKQEHLDYMTALHHAAARGNSSMVSFLLEQKGLDISLKDSWGRDAIDVAIVTGNQAIIDELFQFRSGLRSDGSDPKPSTPSATGSVIHLKPK